jgi:hypothetical protein
VSELEDMVRRIAREEARRPEYVSQRSVKAVIGIEPRAYLRAAAAKRWPSTNEQRLVVSRTDDVLRYFEVRLRAAAASPANDANPEAIAFARVGARRVGG